MAISNGTHIPEENKLRILLERIAADLSSKYGENFQVRTSSFDKQGLPKGFEEMNYIARKNESGEEEIVLGIDERKIDGLDGKYIRAYFSHVDVQQSARKHLEGYIKKEEISNVIYEKFTNSKF
ncbi:hypothetical protein HY449_04655 [Candidatus Pacearchaeota archaeon]|nr:hypothetical protein [Candidatus Pacearchaeota archaeon]